MSLCDFGVTVVTLPRHTISLLAVGALACGVELTAFAPCLQRARSRPACPPVLTACIFFWLLLRCPRGRQQRAARVCVPNCRRRWRHLRRLGCAWNGQTRVPDRMQGGAGGRAWVKQRAACAGWASE